MSFAIDQAMSEERVDLTQSQDVAARSGSRAHGAGAPMHAVLDSHHRLSTFITVVIAISTVVAFIALMAALTGTLR